MCLLINQCIYIATNFQLRAFLAFLAGFGLDLSLIMGNRFLGLRLALDLALGLGLGDLGLGNRGLGCLGLSGFCGPVETVLK